MRGNKIRVSKRQFDKWLIRVPTYKILKWFAFTAGLCLMIYSFWSPDHYNKTYSLTQVTISIVTIITAFLLMKKFKDLAFIPESDIFKKENYSSKLGTYHYQFQKLCYIFYTFFNTTPDSFEKPGNTASEPKSPHKSITKTYRKPVLHKCFPRFRTIKHEEPGKVTHPSIELFRKAYIKQEYFINSFLLFLLSIIILYIIFFIEGFYKLANPELDNDYIDFFKFLFNSLSYCFIFWCFIELYNPSKSFPERVRKNLRHFSMVILVGICVLYFITISLNAKRKQHYYNGEIGVFHTSDSLELQSADSLMDLVKPVQRIPNILPLKNDSKQGGKTGSVPEPDPIQKEPVSDTSGLAINISSTPHETFKENENSDMAYNRINDNGIAPESEVDDGEDQSMGYKTTAKKQDTLIKSYILPSTNTLKGDKLMLALHLKPMNASKWIILPEHIIVIDSNGKEIDSILIEVRITKPSLRTGVVTINPHTADTIIYTGLKVVFNSAIIKSSGIDSVQLSPEVSLYKEPGTAKMKFVFGLLSGLINAVALSLLIGRLDSKLIGLPNPVIGWLFLYAGLQVFFPLLSDIHVNAELRSIILLAAFVLKVFLALVLYYCIIHGRLLTYFFCFRELDKRADAIYDNQYEFVIYRDHQSHHYSFYVAHKNQKFIQTDKFFESARKAIECISLIRKSIIEFEPVIKSVTFYPERHLLKRYSMHASHLFYLEATPELNAFCVSSDHSNSQHAHAHDKQEAEYFIYSRDLKEKEVEVLIRDAESNLPYCKIRNELA